MSERGDEALLHAADMGVRYALAHVRFWQAVCELEAVRREERGTVSTPESEQED